MTNTISKRFLILGLVAVGFILAGGHVSSVSAQRDPFELPAWKKPKPAPSTVGKDGKPMVPANTPVAAASIEARIAYFKRQREEAANAGLPLPKVTSVITLEEMAVTGIFRTPRGYAAMVEAKPIKLSYAIYPGEKFFDGQLVAIEDNKLVFRKVTKMSSGKFVTTVETKSLRQATTDQEVQGTAPAGATSETKSEGSTVSKDGAIVPASVVSPLEEMIRQQSKTGNSPGAGSNKGSKRPVKVAGIRR